MNTGDDMALDSLFEVLTGPEWQAVRGSVLNLNACWHPALQAFRDRLHCVSRFRSEARALEHSGITPVQAIPSGLFELVMLRPSRQRVQNRAMLTQAATSLAVNGVLITAASNDAGARSLQSDVQQLMGAVECRSLNRCRVVWSLPQARTINWPLAQQWREAAAPRAVEATPLRAAPGMFSWDRIDEGSRLLSEHLPEEIGSRVADLGAGWGYLSAMAMRRCRYIQTLDLYEADLDSLHQAEQNLASLTSDQVESQPSIRGHWADVAEGRELAQGYDAVLCNPPFHSGNRADPQLGRQFIMHAAGALRPGGWLWLVANRHLPYESQLRQSFGEVRMLVQSGTYKVFSAVKGRA